jgi:hypothetical protein
LSAGSPPWSASAILMYSFRRKALAERWPPIMNPFGEDLFFQVWEVKRLDAETQQPFLIHVVDDHVGHFARFTKAFGFAPV